MHKLGIFCVILRDLFSTWFTDFLSVGVPICFLRLDSTGLHEGPKIDPNWLQNLIPRPFPEVSWKKSAFCVLFVAAFEKAGALET